MLVFTLAVISVLEFSDATPSSRIHGGVDAPPGLAPHMVALLTGATSLRVVCGGSIITDTHVLTAAHCVTPYLVDGQLSPSFHGRVGSNIWHSGGTLVQFQTHHIHPEWDEDTLKYDASVLRLTEKLVMSATVAAIRMEFGWVGGEEPAYVTGWGTTWPYIGEDMVQLAPTPDKLQLIYLDTLAHQQCNESIAALVESNPRIPPVDPNIEICTFHSIRYGLCHGDSGSALVSLKTGRLVGWVSWGALPCARGAPDVCARAMAFQDFFESIIGKH